MSYGFGKLWSQRRNDDYYSNMSVHHYLSCRLGQTKTETSDGIGIPADLGRW